MSLDTTRLQQLAQALIDVQLTLQPLRDQEAALKAQIRETLATEGPGMYQAGPITVKATANRRLDQNALAKAYPASERPDLYTLTVNTAAARAALPPNVIDQYMTTIGDLRIGLS